MMVGLSPLPLNDDELRSFGCKPTAKVELVFTLGKNDSDSERKLRMSQDFEVLPDALLTLLRSPVDLDSPGKLTGSCLSARPLRALS
jgi:hypothetical protein